jgi:hypothetical protein
LRPKSRCLPARRRRAAVTRQALRARHFCPPGRVTTRVRATFFGA